MQLSKLKELVYFQLKEVIENKIELAEVNLQSIIDSRNNETKSSAGDKYETGRAQMQIEQQKTEAELQKALEFKLHLPNINLHKRDGQIKLGSLVRTNHGYFLIWFGIGKISLKEESVYAISLASPLGNILNHKKEGDLVKFLDKSYQIIEIA